MQFIITPGYIIFNSITTTTSILLKDIGNNNLLVGSFKQSCSHSRLQLIHNICRKWVMVIELDNNIIDQPVSRIKIKKVTKGEFIAVKINKQTFQNITSLEIRRVENMKPEAKILVDIKIYYPIAFFDLILTQFSSLIHILKANHDNYGRNITAEYYKILEIGHLHDKFDEKLLEKLKQSII